MVDSFRDYGISDRLRKSVRTRDSPREIVFRTSFSASFGISSSPSAFLLGSFTKVHSISPSGISGISRSGAGLAQGRPPPGWLIISNRSAFPVYGKNFSVSIVVLSSFMDSIGSSCDRCMSGI